MGTRLARLVVAAARATAATAITAGSKGHLGGNREAHVGQINGNALHFIQQSFAHAEGVPSLFLGCILVIRLVQSQSEARAASTSREVNPNRIFSLVRKEGIKLLAGSVGQLNHGVLHISGAIVTKAMLLACQLPGDFSSITKSGRVLPGRRHGRKHEHNPAA